MKPLKQTNTIRISAPVDALFGTLILAQTAVEAQGISLREFCFMLPLPSLTFSLYPRVAIACQDIASFWDARDDLLTTVASDDPLD